MKAIMYSIMYSSTATKISVAWRHISVQSLQGAKWSGSNMFFFQDWLLWLEANLVYSLTRSSSR